MFRCSLNLIESFCKPRYTVSKKSVNILENFARGNSTLTAVSNKPVVFFPLLSHPPQLNEIKCPKHSTVYSTFNISLPSLKNFAINKKLPSTNFDKSIRNEYFQEEMPDIRQRNVYWMGSLLKKRRRKMNRQKYKKRRKRDRFKREALKNLRKRKRQRKERAAERKQAILSNMVVNKSISKRRARYLSHKLLPGVVKGQGLG